MDEQRYIVWILTATLNDAPCEISEHSDEMWFSDPELASFAMDAHIYDSPLKYIPNIKFCLSPQFKTRAQIKELDIVDIDAFTMVREVKL